MSKKIMLPSLFVLNFFLVGMAPKTSKAGTVKTNTDSVSYNIKPDSCYQLLQNSTSEHADSSACPKDSVGQQKEEKKDSVSYTVSWQGKLWVKYTSDDGSGFTRIGGSRTWRNANPGAIRPSKITAQNGACGAAGGFAVFPTEEQGMNALRALLLSKGYINLTLAAAIYKYAPPSDHNNTYRYQRRLAQITGLSLRKQIKQLTAKELDDVMLAIKEIEGWEPGETETFTMQNTMASNTFDCTKLLLNNQKQRTA